MEAQEVQMLKNSLQESITRKEMSKPTEADEDLRKQRIKDKLINALKKKVYNWSPMTYDAYNSLVYLYGRSVQEYAVLIKVFLEIFSRDAQFKPRSLFDFGSGIGTAIW